MNDKELETLEQEDDPLVEDELPDHYSFAPSITKTRIINGKTYIVRSYFAGKKDFKKIMCDHAFKQTLAEKRKGTN